MSQFKEDAHIAAVFDEVGYGSRVLCDIGARYEGSNAANLIRKHGFTGTLIDASEEACDELRRQLPTATVVNSKVMPARVNQYVPPDCWFLSIDIDSADWWVWANLKQRPALVLIETNPLPGLFVANMDCEQKDANGYGCSVEGAKVLGMLKGYDYIGRTEANCFFVRSEFGCTYRLPEVPHKGKPCGAKNNIFQSI